MSAEIEAGYQTAGALVALALIDKLVEKGLFTKEDARDVINKALPWTAELPSAYRAEEVLFDKLKNL